MGRGGLLKDGEDKDKEWEKENKSTLEKIEHRLDPVPRPSGQLFEA